MKIILNRKEEKVLKEFKEDLQENLRESGGKSTNFGSVVNDYDGITVRPGIGVTEIKIEEEMVIDFLVMLHRISGVLIHLGLTVKNCIKQMGVAERRFDKTWKKEKKEGGEER